MRLLSGKFVIRMSADLHARLKQEAMESGRSLNQVCIEKLQAGQTSRSGFGFQPEIPHLIPPGFIEAIVLHWGEQLLGIVLFGSAARGEATEHSDIDLLLVMLPEIDINRNLYKEWEVFSIQYGKTYDSSKISAHFVRLPQRVRDAGGLWYETAIEGSVLWQREHKISRFLALIRQSMAQGEIRRCIFHGSPYWVKEF